MSMTEESKELYTADQLFEMDKKSYNNFKNNYTVEQLEQKFKNGN